MGVGIVKIIVKIIGNTGTCNNSNAGIVGTCNNGNVGKMYV